MALTNTTMGENMNNEQDNHNEEAFENKLMQVIANLSQFLGEDDKVVEFLKCHFRLADNQTKINTLQAQIRDLERLNYEKIRKLEEENTTLLLLIDEFLK